jgi:hypothetical protein
VTMPGKVLGRFLQNPGVCGTQKTGETGEIPDKAGQNSTSVSGDEGPEGAKRVPALPDEAGDVPGTQQAKPGTAGATSPVFVPGLSAFVPGLETEPGTKSGSQQPPSPEITPNGKHDVPGFPGSVRSSLLPIVGTAGEATLTVRTLREALPCEGCGGTEYRVQWRMRSDGSGQWQAVSAECATCAMAGSLPMTISPIVLARDAFVPLLMAPCSACGGTVRRRRWLQGHDGREQLQQVCVQCHPTKPQSRPPGYEEASDAVTQGLCVPCLVCKGIALYKIGARFFCHACHPDPWLAVAEHSDRPASAADAKPLQRRSGDGAGGDAA